MADQPRNLEEEVAAIIAASFEETDPKAELAQDGNTEQEEKRVIDVDLYRLPNGGILLLPGNAANPLDVHAVESEAPTTDPITQTPTVPLTPVPQKGTSNEPETEIPQPVPERHRRIIPSYVLIPLLLLFVLSAGTLTYLFLLPLTASADITITPLTRSLHKDVTLTIASSPRTGEIQGRSLAGMSLTKSETVAATGHGHDDARAAAGVITFYNSDSTPLTIPAGVTFTTQNGATIVTDNAVTVQAAVLPEVGSAITPAHVLQAGSIGNIPARTIYTRCCGSVFVTATNNTPFNGGQDARDYTYIQTSDIRNASQDLLTSVTPQVTTALTKQLHAGEGIVTPFCTPRTTSSAEPGAEAPSVTVSVTQTCISVAYLTDSLNQVATSTLAHSANLTNYQQVGIVQVTVNTSTVVQKTARLQVALSGIWAYSFSQQELYHLKTLIKGVSKQRAQALLQSHPGIQEVTVTLKRLDFKDQLPTSPGNIHIIFIVL